MTAATGALSVAVLPVVTAPAALASDEPAAPVVEPAPAAEPEWQDPTTSVTAEPADLAAGVDSGEPARVVSIVAGPEGPQVDTERTVGTAQTLAAIDRAQNDPDLLAVGLDRRVRLADLPGQVRATSTDPLRRRQWGLDLLSVESAWSSSQGNGVVVAVVDSGVDSHHPDLAAAMVSGVNTRTDSGDHSSPGVDQAGHGTHVAGIIAARANNGTGVAGVAPQAQIMPVKVLDADGSGWMSDVVEGIRWAVDHGAGVVNLSLGGTDADFMESVITYAVDRGVVVVAAAGNESSRQPSYPAAFPGVLSVSALDDSGRVADYSNYGPTVDLAAPGSDVVSTVPGGYDSMSGTSMATPHVAGVAALVRSVAPDADVASILTGTASDLGAAGRDEHYGHGRVNAVASLQTACGSAACQYQPPAPVTPPAPAVRRQTIQRLPVLRVGARRTLPATTRQGAQITSWRTTNAKCAVRHPAGRWQVVGLARGTCRLRVTAAATTGYAALAAVTTVRVIGGPR